MHLLPAALDAGGWFVHGVPGRTILRSLDAALQELPLRLPKVHRPRQVQLRRVLAAAAFGQIEQPVRALLYRQREGAPNRGVLFL